MIGKLAAVSWLHIDTTRKVRVKTLHIMKIGLITRANNRGLGIQSWEFYRHLKPHKTVVVVLGGDDEKTLERYPDAVVLRGQVKDEDFAIHFAGCDVVLSFETFYNDRAVEYAKGYGNIKFVLQPNYEQQGNIDLADGIIVPSVWYFNDWRHGKKIYLPVPINREKLPFKLRTKAETFVHNSGTQLSDDRNGTLTLLEAMQFVKSDIKLVIHIQKLFEMMYNKVVELASKDPRITLSTEQLDNYWDFWQSGDVFIYPRKYGGLALPTNEAMSVGMPVVMPDLNPQNQYLPKDLLIPVSKVETIKMFRPIESCTVDPRELAKKIDFIAGSDLTKYSQAMDMVATNWSWEKLLPKYKAALKQVC